MFNVIVQRASKYSLQAINRRLSKMLPSKRCCYFAFGANMDAEMLAKKSAFAHQSEPAVLKGYEIEITSPCEMMGKGFASVSQKHGSDVFGVLHKVTRLELALLDLLEWVPFHFHQRIKVSIAPLRGSDSVTAWIYVAKSPKAGLKTSAGYRDLLVRSAKKYGFPQPYVHHLSSLPVAETFEFDHGFRLSNPAKRRLFEKHLKPVYRIHDNWRERLCQRLP